MAIDRNKYPISYKEACDLLRQEADRLCKENMKDLTCGDLRPEIFAWAADQLESLSSAKN